MEPSSINRSSHVSCGWNIKKRHLPHEDLGMVNPEYIKLFKKVHAEHNQSNQKKNNQNTKIKKLQKDEEIRVLKETNRLKEEESRLRAEEMMLMVNEIGLMAEEERLTLFLKEQQEKNQLTEQLESITLKNNEQRFRVHELIAENNSYHETFYSLSIERQKEIFLSALNTKTSEEWVIIPVLEDGNCLFSSISKQLEKTCVQHLKQRFKSTNLRLICQIYVKQNKEKYQDIYEKTKDDLDEVQWNDFLQNMGMDRTWATDLEIYALEEILERNIYNYQDYDVKLEKYPPFHRDPQIEVHLYNREPIYIHHTKNEHFDIVIKKNKRRR